MKVLLVGMNNRNFLPDLQQNLCKQNISADLLDLLEGCFVDCGQSKILFGRKITSRNFLIKNLLLYLNFCRAFAYLKNHHVHYHVCNIHFMDVRYYFFKRKICKLADKLVISTYGTDFYKYSRYAFLQKPFYKKAGQITFANEITRDSFDKFYQLQFSDKLSISRFGLSLLPLIKETRQKDDHAMKARKNFGFPDDKILLTIGYNSSPNNQHLKIIDQVVRLAPEVKKKIFLIFPMTYGGFKQHISELEIRMNESGIPYSILKQYLSTDALVMLRLASDIMINLPVSDQLSATMCEYLYTQNWVITGGWLPYDSIDQTGVNYDRIASMDQLANKLNDVLTDMDETKKLTLHNPDKIWNFSAWEQNIIQWIDVYKA